jgi:hypothetical protein
MQRREYLSAAAAVGIAAVAGCSEQEEVSGNDDGSGGGDLVALLEHELGQADLGPSVQGRVENVSDKELLLVTVDVAYLDGEGVQIGEGLDTVSDLAAGRIWEFDAPYLDTDDHRIDDYEITVTAQE